MKKYALTVVIVLFCNLNIYSVVPNLSPQSQVSLITISPGDPLYSTFGHSLLWIYDPVQSIDRAYSYGTFDFSTENFYWKFIKGTLPYQISVSTMTQNLDFYKNYENRAVKEQKLDLSPSQKQRLFDYLETNLLPENRLYAYRFFLDNCATRLRDALQYSCGDSLQWKEFPAPKSYRKWMNLYLQNHSFVGLFMNIAIGKPSDEIASDEKSMYLPDNLFFCVSKAINGNRPLVKSFSYLHNTDKKTNQNHFSFFFLFFPLLFLIKKTRLLFYFCLGSIGIIIAFLWWGTDHGVTQNNPSILFLLGFLLYYLKKNKVINSAVFAGLLYFGILVQFSV